VAALQQRSEQLGKEAAANTAARKRQQLKTALNHRIDINRLRDRLGTQHAEIAELHKQATALRAEVKASQAPATSAQRAREHAETAAEAAEERALVTAGQLAALQPEAYLASPSRKKRRGHSDVREAKQAARDLAAEFVELRGRKDDLERHGDARKRVAELERELKQARQSSR